MATGADLKETYLSFQEYFQKLGRILTAGASLWLPSWGLPGPEGAGEIAAIGGKDSMSGSSEDLDVPPTLVSFAVTTDKVSRIPLPEFKGGRPSGGVALPRVRRTACRWQPP